MSCILVDLLAYFMVTVGEIKEIYGLVLFERIFIAEYTLKELEEIGCSSFIAFESLNLIWQFQWNENTGAVAMKLHLTVAMKFQCNSMKELKWRYGDVYHNSLATIAQTLKKFGGQ